jgi:hypothetical protein
LPSSLPRCGGPASVKSCEAEWMSILMDENYKDRSNQGVFYHWKVHIL